MNRVLRLRLFKSKWSLLLIGLMTVFTVLILGITMVPTISAPILNALVGDLGNNAALLPTGQMITPLATPGSTFVPLATDLRQDGSADAHGAITTALSPDGKTLLLLTTGYNTGFSTEEGTSITRPVLDPVTGQPSTITTGNAEWIFVYDVSSAVSW